MSEIQYDGCSGGMSKAWRWLFGAPPPWEGCCDRHDQPYAQGGTAKQRFEADIDCLLCVAQGGHPWWAIAMFIAVRLGGGPYLPTPWRWGFRRSFWSNPTSWFYKEKEEHFHD